MLLNISSVLGRQDSVHFGAAVVAILLFAFHGLPLGLGPLSLEANGSVREYQKNLAGNYVIGIGTVPYSPSPWMVHFASYVENRETKFRYPNAEVVLTGLGPVTDEQSQLVIEPIRMNNTVLDPTYYELNVPLNHEGLWTITLEISVDEGSAMTDFEIEVLETNPVVPILTLMALLGFLFILGVSGRAWIREYRKKRS